MTPATIIFLSKADKAFHVAIYSTEHDKMLYGQINTKSDDTSSPHKITVTLDVLGYLHQWQHTFSPLDSPLGIDYSIRDGLTDLFAKAGLQVKLPVPNWHTLHA